MPTGNITKRAVDALSPGAKGQEFLWDDEVPGFGYRVTAKGARSYVFQYRMGGRGFPARRITIGRHGVYTPDEARKEAKRLRQMVDRGDDPLHAKQERQRQYLDLAFDSYVERFVELYLKSEWKNWKLAESLLEREAVPVLGSKPLPSVTRADLSAVWDRLRDRPAAAKLAHAVLRKLFNWAVERGDIDRSPVEGVSAVGSVTKRDRVLDDKELRLAWRGAGAAGAPLTGFYRLLILTMQRRDEVAGLDWSELDRGSALWTLPGARTKNGQPSLVPLSPPTVEVLDEIAGGEEWPRSGLVFPSATGTPFSGFSKAKKALDAQIAKANDGEQLARWTIHDLRRTGATGLQKLGVRFEVVEAVLNHVSGSKSGVAGIYQRHQWSEEKRTALDAWGRHVAGLLSPASASNIVAIR